MIGCDSHNEINSGGPWPWMLGVVLAGGIIYLMFACVLPIS
jgi:hypothetical protein